MCRIRPQKEVQGGLKVSLPEHWPKAFAPVKHGNKPIPWMETCAQNSSLRATVLAQEVLNAERSFLN